MSTASLVTTQVSRVWSHRFSQREISNGIKQLPDQRSRRRPPPKAAEVIWQLAPGHFRELIAINGVCNTSSPSLEAVKTRVGYEILVPVRSEQFIGFRKLLAKGRLPSEWPRAAASVKSPASVAVTFPP